MEIPEDQIKSILGINKEEEEFLNKIYEFTDHERAYIFINNLERTGMLKNTIVSQEAWQYYYFLRNTNQTKEHIAEHPQNKERLVKDLYEKSYSRFGILP